MSFLNRPPRGNTAILTLILVGLFILGGAIAWKYQGSSLSSMSGEGVELVPAVPPVSGVCTQDTKLCSDGSSVSRIPPTCEFPPCPDEIEKPSLTTPTLSYQGQRLAGGAAPLLDFAKSDYEQAIASDKLVVLYFYANWCPICVAEFPKMQTTFDGLTNSNVIGFRVNFNDNQTDDDEEQLARQFGVAYQHTKVFVKNGQRILKSPESWEQTRYVEEITRYQ